MLLAVAASLLWPSAAPRTQELEPRAYSAAPVSTNFLAVVYSHSRGGVLVDPSLPVTNVEARIDGLALGYVRTFGLFGRSASLGVVLPYAWANVSGEIGEQQREVSRAGLSDLRLRFSMNLLGGPALTREEFVTYRPTTTLGASLSVVAPLGQYDASRLINIGSNRWAFKPEVGVTHTMGKVFLEASAGAWLFTDNTDFFGGQRREQAPLWTFQLHAGYTFRSQTSLISLRDSLQTETATCATEAYSSGVAYLCDVISMITAGL